MRFVEESHHGKQTRVFRLDRDRILAELRERASRLLAARPEVIEVRLFGSLARDDAKPGSDADLFVLLCDAADSFPDRAARMAPSFEGVGIGCDLFVYTQAEWDQLCRESRRITRVVTEEGIVLAARCNAPPGDVSRS